jgi:hypothetical protein
MTINEAQEQELKSRLQAQVEWRKARVQDIKTQFAQKQGAIRNVLHREKLREAELVKRLSHELGQRIRQRSVGTRNEQRQRIESIKGQERLLPFKLRYLQHKKQERIREVLQKNAEQEEARIRAKLQQLEDLDLEESRLATQLRLLSSRHVFSHMQPDLQRLIRLSPAPDSNSSILDRSFPLVSTVSQGRNQSVHPQPALSLRA